MGRRGNGSRFDAEAVTPAAAASAASIGSTLAVTPSGHTTDDVAEIRRVLSEHLKPKELEALSWRYGLNRAADDPIAIAAATAAAAAAAATATESTPTTKATAARDYEEEALEDLFGKGGILASYSADPLPSTARAIQSERSAKKKKAASVCDLSDSEMSFACDGDSSDDDSAAEDEVEVVEPRARSRRGGAVRKTYNFSDSEDEESEFSFDD